MSCNKSSNDNNGDQEFSVILLFTPDPDITCSIRKEREIEESEDRMNFMAF